MWAAKYLTEHSRFIAKDDDKLGIKSRSLHIILHMVMLCSSEEGLIILDWVVTELLDLGQVVISGDSEDWVNISYKQIL